MSESFAFNARGVEPAKPSDNNLIPDNWYRAWITGTDIRKTNAGDGRFLELAWELLEGQPYGKRRLWERHNIENKNEMTVKIALEQLSAICHAINVLEFQNPAELVGVPLMIKVGKERGKNGNPDRNKIYGYLPDGDPKAVVKKPKVGAHATGAVSGARHPALQDDDDDSLPF